MHALVSILLAVVGVLCAFAARAEDAPVVKDGSKVMLQYSLTLENGEKIEEDDEIDLVQGKHDVLPALERELAGMKVDDAKRVTLSVEDGYGPVRQDLLKEIPAAHIPAEARKAGAMLMADDGKGTQRLVRVAELKGDKVVLDLNHPLAGQRLIFDLKVLKIE
jgi:FKBP-type peptidyl-prolyl cis-trans isomerase 2